MRTLLIRASLVLLGVLASPVVVFAATDEGSKDTIWEWFVRFVIWAAGGWHGY